MTTAESRSADPTGTAPAASGSFLTTVPLGAIAAYGVLTVLLGIAVLVWPKATLAVVVALLAVQLLFSAVEQLLRAFSSEASGGGERALLAVGGIVALLLALLVIRQPLQTLVIITTLIGAWWVVRGLIDLFRALTGGTNHALWTTVLGLVSLVAGVFVLVNPGLSLHAFVVLAGIWMIVYGAIVAVTAVMMRRTTA